MSQSIVGKTIVGVRRLTDEEIEQIWGFQASAYDMPLLIQLDDGSELVPSADAEGNGIGVLFHFDAEGKGDILLPPQDTDTE